MTPVASTPGRIVETGSTGALGFDIFLVWIQRHSKPQVKTPKLSGSRDSRRLEPDI